MKESNSAVMLSLSLAYIAGVACGVGFCTLAYVLILGVR